MWWFFSPLPSFLLGLQLAVGDYQVRMAVASPCLDSYPCVSCSMCSSFLQLARPSKLIQQNQHVNTRKTNCAQRMNGSIPGLLGLKLETATLGLTSFTLLEERNNCTLERQWDESGILKSSEILSEWVFPIIQPLHHLKSSPHGMEGKTCSNNLGPNFRTNILMFSGFWN